MGGLLTRGCPTHGCEQADVSAIPAELRNVTHVGGRQAAEIACAAVLDYFKVSTGR